MEQIIRMANLNKHTGDYIKYKWSKCTKDKSAI